MKKLLITFNLLFITTIITAQCLSGDCKNGFGKIQYQDGVYEGTFKNGNLDGIGLMQYTNGTYYFGQIKNSKFTGFGYFQWKEGQNHIGKWENNLQNGDGIFNDAKGNPTAGTWEKGVSKSVKSTVAITTNPANCLGNCVNGYGRITNPNEPLIQAIFENEKAKLGRIIKTNQYTYDGQIDNSLPNGYGQISYTNGDHYFGFIKDGKKHGEGIFTPKGKPKIYGNWNNDQLFDPNAFNEEEFCTELTKYISLSKKKRTEQKMENFTGDFVPILKKKFLNHFEIQQTYNKISIDSTLIIFPIDEKGIPKVSLQMLQDGLKKCEKLTSKNSNEYNFNKIKLSILEGFSIFGSLDKYKLRILYPFENLECISGDCQNGFGKKEYSNDDAYEGNFVNGNNNGNGSYTWANGNNYEGDWKDGERTGKGILTWANGDKYEGDFINNNRNGKGTIMWFSGTKYEGDFLNNKLTGYGRYYNAEGLLYEGYFLDDMYHGTGTNYLKDGSKFIANFKEGKLHGFGQFFMADGKLAYEGQYEDGVAKGQGTLFYRNGSKYIGNFSDNIPNGLGKIVDKDGKIINEGQFKDGEYVGQ